MCHQTVSLVARHLEANGLPTVMLACARDITASANPPRALFTDLPLGNTCGRPDEPDHQREILMRGLALLHSAEVSGEIVDVPSEWPDNRNWKEDVYNDAH